MPPSPQGDREFKGLHHVGKKPRENPVQHPKPKQVFNCETCDKSQRKYNLKIHMKNKHESTPKTPGRKRKLPFQWSDGTKKEYAKKLKKSFKQRVKDLELEEEIKDLFKRDQGREKPSPSPETLFR